MREFIDYIKGMLDGKQPQSFSRGSCAFIIYFKVCESLYIVSKTNAMCDLPTQWMALISLLYLGGKGIDAITAVKSGGENGVVTQ